MRWIGRLVLAGTLVIGGVSGCGRVLTGALTALPAFFVTEQQEVALGQQAAQQVLAQTPLVQNQALQDYVNRLGKSIVPLTTRSNLNFHFYVLQDSTPNAFALPGGYIFVTSKLLSLMQNEAQLVGVLGHEVGHVAAKHHVAMIREAAVARGITAAALGTDAGATKAIAGVLAQLVLRGFGRSNELEADRLGVQFASQLNYVPSQLADFLQRLNQATGSQPAWLYPLSTHPPVEERVTAIDAWIRDRQLQGTLLNQSQFLALVGNQP